MAAPVNQLPLNPRHSLPHATLETLSTGFYRSPFDGDCKPIGPCSIKLLMTQTLVQWNYYVAGYLRPVIADYAKNWGRTMDLVTYLKDEIDFLTEQMKRAEDEKDNSMHFLCDARITEAKRILTQVNDGKINQLKAD